MESSRFPPTNEVQNWLGPLDPVMLAAAAAGSICSAPSILDPVSSNTAATRFAPLVYQHFFHQMPPARNQHQLDLLTYHAAALHQHLAVAAAAAAAASNRTFQHCQQLPSTTVNRLTPSCAAPVGDSDGSSKKFGYSVADLLADHQQTTNCNDRINNTSSPDNSGILLENLTKLQ